MYKVNLLPSELKNKHNYSNWKVLTLKLLIYMIVFSLLGIYCGFVYQYIFLRQNTAALEKVLRDKSSELQNIESKRKDITEAETKLHKLDSLVKNRVTWSKLLLDLELIRPVDIQFTEMKMYQDLNSVEDKGCSDKMNIKGVEKVPSQAFTVDILGEAASINSVTKLYKELSNQAYLQEVKLKSVEQNKNADSEEIKFLISVILKGKNYDS